MLLLSWLILLAQVFFSVARQPGAARRRSPSVGRNRIFPNNNNGIFPNSPMRQSNVHERSAPIYQRQESTSSGCGSGGSITAKAPKSNIFAGLTNDEAVAVTAFLHGQKSLNLTATADATR